MQWRRSTSGHSETSIKIFTSAHVWQHQGRSLLLQPLSYWYFSWKQHVWTWHQTCPRILSERISIFKKAIKQNILIHIEQWEKRQVNLCTSSCSPNISVISQTKKMAELQTHCWVVQDVWQYKISAPYLLYFQLGYF